MMMYLVGRGLLGVSALLNICSMLLPWENPNNHFYKFSGDLEYFTGCVQAGAYLDGLRVLVEGVGCLSPSVLGVILLISALLPRGKVNVLTSSILHILLLLVLAAVGGVLFAYDFGEEGADRRLLIAAGGGMGLFVVFAFIEAWIAARSLRRPETSGDAVHVLPLVLFLAAGTALAVLMHGNDVWHSEDYVVIAAASAVGLLGVWMRRGRRASTTKRRAAGASPAAGHDIPFAP